MRGSTSTVKLASSKISKFRACPASLYHTDSGVHAAQVAAIVGMATSGTPAAGQHFRAVEQRAAADANHYRPIVTGGLHQPRHVAFAAVAGKADLSPPAGGRPPARFGAGGALAIDPHRSRELVGAEKVAQPLKAAGWEK